MIEFLKYKKIYFLISTAVIVIGLFSITRWGYRYSIDFVGGSVMEYATTQGRSVIVHTKPIGQKEEVKIRQQVEKEQKSKVKLLRFETVGPTLGRETVNKTIIASIIAVFGILIYMSFAFKGLKFALAAIIAMLHDLLIMLGAYSLMSHFWGAQFDTLFITALLTTMSFSVHDTIVIFDKIREYKRSEGISNIEHFANKALTETLIRSINNSMTIVFMLLALTLLGGSTIRFFVAALLVGTITGTYSSPFVATPILVWLEKRKHS